MYVKAVSVEDYSTGTSYSYDGTSGTWESIESDGGTINANAGSAASASAASSTASSSTTNSDPETFGSSSDSGYKAASASATARTGWPWTTSTSTASTTGAASGVISESTASVSESSLLRSAFPFDGQSSYVKTC